MTVREIYTKYADITIATKKDGLYATRLGADISRFLDMEVNTFWLDPTNCRAYITVVE